MLDNRKKRAAAVRGAKKLLELKTPREEIASTLIELGIREEETESIIDEASKLANTADEVQPERENAREEIAQPQHGQAPEQEIKVREYSNAAAGHGFAEKKRAAPRTKEAPFWKKILPSWKNYIPKLRTGGRNRVKEIMADSPLDAP